MYSTRPHANEADIIARFQFQHLITIIRSSYLSEFGVSLAVVLHQQ